MAASIQPSPQPYALGDGEGPAIWYVNNRATIVATAAQTGGQFGLIDMQVAVGHGPPLHIHHNEDEALWVLEGKLTVQCGEEQFPAGPGAFVYTPRGVPHTFRLEGGRPARLLVLMTPGGGEQFFVEVGRPAAGPGLPSPVAPDVAHLSAVAQHYRMEFVGPPLPGASEE